jgi:integrase
VLDVLEEGRDPRTSKKIAKQTAAAEFELEIKAAEKSATTFRQVAERWIAARSREWSDEYSNKSESRLTNHVYKAFGNLPIDKIDTSMVLAMLRKLEGKDASSAKLETRNKIRQQVRSIFDLAKMENLISNNPAQFDVRTAQLQRQTGKLKPKSRKTLAVEMDDAWAMMPTFWSALSTWVGNKENDRSKTRGSGGLHMCTQILIKLTILTLARPGEIRQAKWSEFNFEKRIWRVPAARMKMGETHLVPLSNQAIVLLRQLKVYTGEFEHLFPRITNKGRNFDDSKSMSHSSALGAMRRMGYQADLHGFRHMGSSKLHSEEVGEPGEERAMWDSLWIEYALSHSDPNKMRRKYNESNYLKARTRMLQWYADQICPTPQLSLAGKSA